MPVYKIALTTLDRIQQFKQLCDQIQRDFDVSETNKSYLMRLDALEAIASSAESNSLGRIMLQVLYQHFKLDLVRDNTPVNDEWVL